MTDPIATACARLAESSDSTPGIQELRAVIRALLIAQSDAAQYRSDRDVLQRQLAERDAAITILRQDLAMLKRPVPVPVPDPDAAPRSAPVPDRDAAAPSPRTDHRLIEALDTLKTLIEQAVDAGAGRRFHHIQTRRGAFLRVVPALEAADAVLAAAKAPSGTA